MSTTHTPEPWRAKAPKPNALDKGWQIDDKHGYSIASVSVYTNAGVTEANAHLMAGAPALLKVVKSLIYVYEHGGPNTQFILRGLLSDAQAALAKAVPS